MRQGTTQFFYCCPIHFGRQFRFVAKSIKRQKGTILTFTEEIEEKPWSVRGWGFHDKCTTDPKSRGGRYRKVTDANISRCTITYEVPK